MAAAAARVSRWHTTCHNLAVTEARKAITTKTIPTMVPVAGNHTEPLQAQVRVAMEDKVGVPPVKVSHYLLYSQAVVLTRAYISVTIRHKPHWHIFCSEKLPRYLR